MRDVKCIHQLIVALEAASYLYAAEPFVHVSAMDFQKTVRDLERRYDFENGEYCRAVGRSNAHLQD